MIGFTYQYNSHEEIITRVGGILSLSGGKLLILIFSIALFFILSYIVFPSLILWHKNKLSEKEKSNKKRLLTQILLQKEIEDEVEKKIQMEEQEKFQN